ncbi:MAG: helix-turn-helix domain-containing protein [Rhodanobacteraceae bacterium]
MIDREDTPDLFSDTVLRDAAATAHSDASPPAGDVSIGERLRAAREAKGLSLADCGHELRLPVKVLERLEGNDFGESEHFVFLRGALSGYARMLGLPPGSCDQTLRAVAPAEQPALVSVTRTSAARWLLQRYGTAATYIVLTATIAVPLVLLGLRGGLERPATRIVSLDQAPAVSTHSAQSKIAAALPGTPAISPDATPFRASMTPFAAIGLNDISGSDADGGLNRTQVAPAPVPSAVTGGRHVLTIAASANCWFEITDANGEKVDSGLLHAGDSRTWRSAGVMHVTLGNADGVSVTRDGQPLALAPYQHANVARFDVFAKAAGSSEND